jgi:hypothetical protein
VLHAAQEGEGALVERSAGRAREVRGEMAGPWLGEGAPGGPAGGERGAGQRWAGETKMAREQAERERLISILLIYSPLFFCSFFLNIHIRIF